jgi:DNA-directed RNA polymerase subunit M/transcription elongation factor TFIIS
MRFCDICKHVLVDITDNKELYYECSACKTRYKSSVSDTLRFTQSYKKNKSDTGGRGDFVNTAAFDVTNPKVYKECSKCSSKIVTSIVSGDNMKFSYLCECGNKF